MPIPSRSTGPRSRALVPVAAAVFLASGCAMFSGPTAPGGMAPLSDRVDALLAEPPYDGVQWGVLAVDAETGEVLYQRNPAVRLIPASNQKLPVTIAALGLYGPDHRWRTPILAHGFARDGVLEGDLVVVGSGDPTLGEPFHESPEDALSAVAELIRDAGVRRVTGALVLDASRWDSTSVPASWMVEDLVATAGATGGPFVVGTGELEIRVRGGASHGAPAIVEWSPMGASTFVEASVTTESRDADARLVVAYRPEARTYTVTGTIGAGQEATRNVPARDPVRLALDALERTMERVGVVVEGGVRVHWDRGVAVTPRCVTGTLHTCAELVRVAEWTSPPLSEITAAILGPSQNWITDQLVRTIGADFGDVGSWPQGLAIVRRYLAIHAGVDSLDLRMEDGSGLSAKNLVTPRAVIGMLRWARENPWFDSYMTGMARPGVAGTTLSGRLAGLEGRVFAKTGTISNVNSLSGYLIRDDGREIVFGILSNGSNLSSAAVRNRIDEVVREIASP